MNHEEMISKVNAFKEDLDYICKKHGIELKAEFYLDDEECEIVSMFVDGERFEGFPLNEWF